MIFFSNFDTIDSLLLSADQAVKYVLDNRANSSLEIVPHIFVGYSSNIKYIKEFKIDYIR